MPPPDAIITVADGIKALTTVAAAGLGAWVAAQVALNRWRAEMTGRQRAELAEDTLADLYRLSSALEMAALRLLSGRRQA